MIECEPSRREVLLLTHTGRPGAAAAARLVIERLQAEGIGVRVPQDEQAAVGDLPCVPVAPGSAAAFGCELVVVLGGDGTILRAAEVARSTGTPVLGVNLGHVGFLAESEWDALDLTVRRLAAKDYVVEERMTLDVSVHVDGVEVATSWALNEASVEKAARERMIELILEIDGRPVSRWGCDGLVAATPTGSTAYAFSAGGPVVWPEVEALLAVPLSPHALFGRPLVLGPSSTLAVEVLSSGTASAVLWCDGRRAVSLPPGARVVVTRGHEPVRLARLHVGPFTDRLVAKFRLPVEGWRGEPPSAPVG